MLIYLLGVALLFATACEQDTIDHPQKLSDEELLQLEESQLMSLDESEPVLTMYRGLSEIKVRKAGKYYVSDGDILIRPEELSEKFPTSNIEHRAVGRINAKWPDNTVYYAIASDLPKKRPVTNAIVEWEDKTNLSFVK